MVLEWNISVMELGLGCTFTLPPWLKVKGQYEMNIAYWGNFNT